MIKAINKTLVLILSLCLIYLCLVVFQYIDMKTQVTIAQEALKQNQESLNKTQLEVYQLQKKHYYILSQNLNHEYISSINGLEIAFKVDKPLSDHNYVIVDTFRQRIGFLYMDENMIIPNNMFKFYVTSAEDNELVSLDSGFTTFDQINGWYLYDIGGLVEDGFILDTGIMDVFEWIQYENPNSFYPTYGLWNVYFVEGIK